MGVILMVRHGQASFGDSEYDRLSELGRRQAGQLGRYLRAAAIEPGSIVSGSMTRQRGTAMGIVEGACWRQDVHVDSDWNEFDHVKLVASNGHSPTGPRTFQKALEAGMRDWARGRISQVETFEDFAARAMAGLSRVSGSLQSGETTVVVTSAGVLSWIAANLLEGDVAQWIRLNRVCVNTGVTKIVWGRTGPSLVSFNEHSHLAPAEISYR